MAASTYVAIAATSFPAAGLPLLPIVAYTVPPNSPKGKPYAKKPNIPKSTTRLPMPNVPPKPRTAAISNTDMASTNNSRTAVDNASSCLSLALVRPVCPCPLWERDAVFLVAVLAAISLYLGVAFYHIW